jgi:hypothetical protein
MTVPTLILIGERDDLNSAEECRNLVAGRDGWGISARRTGTFRSSSSVYPDAYHAFDAPNLKTPMELRVIISNSINRRRIKRRGAA